MENSLKSELDRMFVLMEYKYSKNKSHILSEEENKEKSPFRMNRVGGGIRVQDPNTGDKIDIPYESLDLFFEKLSSFKKI